MNFFELVIEGILEKRNCKKAEKKQIKEYLRKQEESARKLRSPAIVDLDQTIGWSIVNGKRQRMKPFDTILEQISSVDVQIIKPHIDALRLSMARAEEIDVVMEPVTLAFVGPPRQGKTQLSLNILRILDALGVITVGRSTQDAFCDDLYRASVGASEAIGNDGRYKYFPELMDPEKRRSKCKPEVLFLDEFQSKTVDPHDVPLLLNGVIPLKWTPPMADMGLKGMSFNPVIWILSCNNEFVQHEYSVTAIRDRMHRRLVVLDGKAYDQTCKEDLAPSGDFLGGFRTCKGTFGVWEKFVTQEAHGYTKGSSRMTSTGMGMPPSSTITTGSTVGKSATRTVSNQKFREVRDTLNVARPRCVHMKFVPFTDLIVQLLDAAQAKLDSVIKGAEAVNTQLDVIRDTMKELSVEAEPYYGITAVEACEEMSSSSSSGYTSVSGATPSVVRRGLFD